MVLFRAFVAASYSGFSWLLAELLCLWLSSLELLLLYIIDWSTSRLLELTRSSRLVSKALKAVAVSAKKSTSTAKLKPNRCKKIMPIEKVLRFGFWLQLSLAGLGRLTAKSASQLGDFGCTAPKNHFLPLDPVACLELAKHVEFPE